MLISKIPYSITPTTLTINYPTTKLTHQSLVPLHTSLLKPLLKITNNEISATFEIKNLKSLRQKMDFYKHQKLQFSTNQILDIMTQILEIANYLHKNKMCLGCLTAGQIFYQQNKVFLAGIFEPKMLENVPILYFPDKFLSTKNDMLALKYIIYQLFTLRTPPVPFLCDFNVPRSRFTASGIYCFFEQFFKQKTTFNDLFDDCNVKKLVNTEKIVKIDEQIFGEVEGVEEIILLLEKARDADPEKLAAVLM